MGCFTRAGTGNRILNDFSAFVGQVSSYFLYTTGYRHLGKLLRHYSLHEREIFQASKEGGAHQVTKRHDFVGRSFTHVFYFMRSSIAHRCRPCD